MTARSKWSLVFGALVLASCSGSGSAPELVVHNTALVIQTDAAFAHNPDLPQRFESTVATALEYWGGTWADLDGVTITLAGDQHVQCGNVSGAIGCQDGHEIRVSTRDPSVGTWNCLEATVLVHEIGHAVIGDPEHQDARWMDFEPVVRALSGRPGYEGACTLYPSVWRHALSRH